MRTPMLLAALAAVLTIAAPAHATIAHGLSLFNSICAACHGPAPGAGGPETVHGDISKIQNAINFRVAAMAFLRGSLTTADIQDIADFLSTFDGGVVTPPPPPPPPPPPTLPANTSFEGLWLRTPFDSESGWGINLTHQGNTLFATWFTYDTTGQGMWLVMSDGAKTGDGVYAGSLFRTTGPGFSATPFTNIVDSNYTRVGDISFTFSDASTGVMSYVVNGVSQTKAIARLIFASPAPECTLGGTPGPNPNYQDLWWNSPAGSESGWGVNLVHQGDILFATWFTYEAGGTAAAPAKGMWLVMSNGNKTAPGVYSGDLQRTTGPAFSAVPFNPNLVTRSTVGNATFTFSDASNGTFRYTVNGVTQTKAITRLLFSSPPTVCK